MKWVITLCIFLSVFAVHLVNDWQYNTQAQSCIAFDQTAMIQWGFAEQYTNSSTSQAAIDFIEHLSMIPIQGNPTITHKPVDVRFIGKNTVLGVMRMLYDEPGQLWMVQLLNENGNSCGLYRVDIHDLIQFLNMLGG